MEHVGFFEGPEKLMEVWFTPIVEADSDGLSGNLRTICRQSVCCRDVIYTNVNIQERSNFLYELLGIILGNKWNPNNLETIGLEKWSELLSLVKCTILSEKRNDDMSAFLLSESSLFVSQERVILKTCGQTTLLKCIKPLLELAKNECGLTEVQDFFYSRMNYQEPNLQSTPHQTFQQEVEWLDQLFSDGAGYALGRLNGPDTWFLYTLDNILPGVTQPDQTLEILMHDLDREAMNKFYKSSSSNADEVTRVTGISEFLPGALIDAALFDPCGYSANGLLDNSYFSIHVTPQEECSYASFETNVKVSCYKELISKVLKTFKPGRFLMTLFANEGAPCGFSYKTFQEGSIPGYKLDDLQLSQMKMYNLTYGHYKRIHEKLP